MPLLLEDEDGTAQGNDWARGFTRGTMMRHDGWAELVNHEEHGGCLIPMMMLCHEHDEDPEMRPEPISPEKREEVIVRSFPSVILLLSLSGCSGNHTSLACMSERRLGGDSLLDRNATMLPIRQVRHVRRNGGFVACLDRRVRRLIA